MIYRHLGDKNSFAIRCWDSDVFKPDYGGLNLLTKIIKYIRSFEFPYAENSRLEINE